MQALLFGFSLLERDWSIDTTNFYKVGEVLLSPCLMRLFMRCKQRSIKKKLHTVVTVPVWLQSGLGTNTKYGYNGLRDKTCFDLNHLKVFPINLWHSNLASMLLMECKFLPQEKGAQRERVTCSQEPAWYILIDFFIRNHFPNKCLQTSQELRMLSKCPGHSLSVSLLPSMSWLEFLYLLGIVNSVTKSLRNPKLGPKC